MPRLMLLAALALPWGFTPRLVAADPAPKVKLAVLVVFDQMRGDFVEKWQPLFGEGGFKRMQADGAWFANCHYPYAITSTGPGHAAMLTGCSADKHGITNNEWYDRAAAAEAYCAGTDRYRVVPAPEAVAEGKKPKPVGCPDRLLSPTVADVLKEATGGRGKVFGLSLKDRSAILPCGKRPDGVYWFDGRFVTSSYYRDAVHPWVEAFNKGGAADRWFSKDWTKFRPDLDYEKHSGPDKADGEADVNGQGVVFPHPTTGGKKAVGKEYYDALANSPYGNDLLLEITKACVVAEKLGQRDVPDLLAVSFSSNDLIGHTWGPDSQEVLDVTLRSDALMADLLKFLDEKVGKGNYVVAITADHGVCPLPEFSAKQGKDAKRVSAIALLANAERHLRDTFGTPPKADAAAQPGDGKGKASLWLEKVAAPWVYLNDRLIAAQGKTKTEVTDNLADWLRKQPDVYRVYTRGQLLGQLPADDAIGAMVKRSFHPDRSGDLYVLLKPYYLLSTAVASPVRADSGTNHGTPHEYDTHVPLLVLGPGVVGGKRTERVHPQHAAAIFAHFLGVAPPRDAAYPLPATLFTKP
jgi:hypothetical protein